jgi:hypothetical protein
VSGRGRGRERPKDIWRAIENKKQRMEERNNKEPKVVKEKQR